MISWIHCECQTGARASRNIDKSFEYVTKIGNKISDGHYTTGVINIRIYLQYDFNNWIFPRWVQLRTINYLLPCYYFNNNNKYTTNCILPSELGFDVLINWTIWSNDMPMILKLIIYHLTKLAISNLRMSWTKFDEQAWVQFSIYYKQYHAD